LLISLLDKNIESIRVIIELLNIERLKLKEFIMADNKKNISPEKSQPRPPKNPPPRPTSKLVDESYNFFKLFKREKREMKNN